MVHGEIGGVPDAGMGIGLPRCVVQLGIVGIPQWVLVFKNRVIDGEVRTVFQWGLAVHKGAVRNMEVVGLKEGPFACECLLI